MLPNATSSTNTSEFLPVYDPMDKRLHAFFENTTDAVILLDRQMNILYINSSLEQVLGYTPAEYVQLETRFDLLSPPDQQQGRQLCMALLPISGERVTQEQRVKHKDGTYRWVSSTITNLLEEPDVEVLLVSIRDITAQKCAEEERQHLIEREQQARHEARQEQMHLRSLFAQAPALIHILQGPEHEFEFFHPLGKALVGGRDLTGMKVRDALPEYEGQGYFEMLDNVYQTGEPASFTEMVSFLAAADGSLIERFFDGVFQAWYDADGKIAGVMNFAVDVTEKARARQQIEDLATELQRKQERLVQINEELLCQRDELSAVNIELEHSNQARKRFLSTTSHELRTPLTSILGFSRILLQNAENANWSTQEKDALVRILKNGEHLLALINDVLDLARIDSGRVEITTSQVEIRPLFTSILEDMQPLAQERGLILRIEVLPEVQSLQTDGVKLRQILLNLVANAIKFTERGEIIISATRTTCAASTKECLALAVEDTGIGILPEHHERLFESFYQVDGGSSRRFGGTGLGLAIVHQLTTLLGGTISVASEPGKGSTFTVTLPCEIESSQVTP